MRRLFIIRRDLDLSPGKLAAMVGHCCEAYWMNLIKDGCDLAEGDELEDADGLEATEVSKVVSLPCDVLDRYVGGIFTKTICQARNRSHLMKAAGAAREAGLVECVDFGLIDDRCLTELKPENPDGTTTVGIWFRPLPDDVAHGISRKYPLYRD